MTLSKNKGNWLIKWMAGHLKLLDSNVPNRPTFMCDVIQVLPLQSDSLVHMGGKRFGLDTLYRRHRVHFCSDHHTHQHTHCQQNFHKHLMADKHNIPKGKMHSKCRLLPEDIVCKITQRNNIRRENTFQLSNS